MCSTATVNAFVNTLLHTDMSKALHNDERVLIPNSIYEVLICKAGNISSVHAVMQADNGKLIMKGQFDTEMQSWKVPDYSEHGLNKSTVVYAMSKLTRFL